MKKRSADDVMTALGDEIILELDEIARTGHRRFMAYPADILVELDIRAQAACTYSHMLAEADRHFVGRPRVRPFDLSGLKVWLFEDADVIVRLKKMDEDGRTRNYPTKQAKRFDLQMDLPHLPAAPVRISAGYLLDPTNTAFVRSQVAMPISPKRAEWCVAVVPEEQRVAGERIWSDVTRQASFR